MANPFPQPFVRTSWLAARLEDPELRILDCSVVGRLTNEYSTSCGSYRFESGRPLWEAGHIPGSVHIDLLEELSDREAAFVFTMPPPEELARALARRGVGDDSVVVLYDRGPTQEAARVWWMLRSIGFDRAGVLDGGWPLWVQEGRPVSRRDSSYPPGRLSVRPRPGCFVGKNEVKAASSLGNRRLLNVLSAREFRGQEARYGRRGRIPGSLNLPFGRLLDPDSGRVVPPEERMQLLIDLGIEPEKPLITYCGGGLAAAFVAMALTAAGKHAVSVFDGSMLEWAADPKLPLETG